MSSNRRIRLISAMVLLINLLFTQWAVASYVCPALAPKASDAAAMAEAGMPCAEAMSADSDAAQPNLCQAHCQAGQQSADRYEPPAPLAALALFASYRPPGLVLPACGPALQPSQLERSTAPPLVIRHCSLRL